MTDHKELDLAIATAPKRRSTHYANGTVRWGTVLRWPNKPKVGSKESGNYVFGTFEPTPELAHPNCKTQPCREIHRNKRGFVSRQVVALDADYLGSAGVAAEEFMARVESLGMEALVHTTFSSTPEAPRYRLLLPADRAMDATEYTRVATWLVRELGEELFDPTTVQPERYMYRPATKSLENFHSRHFPGFLVDVSDGLLKVSEAEVRRVNEDAERPAVDITNPPTEHEVLAARGFLDTAVRAMEHAEQRNNTLTKWLPTLFRFVLGECLEEDEVAERMREVADLVGIGDEYDSVAQSAWGYALNDGPDRPRDANPASVFPDLQTHELRPGFPAPSNEAPAVALARAGEVFQKWLSSAYDLDSLHAVLATAAVEQLDGDPLWLMVVSGPGNTKTETVASLAGIGALVESTVSSEGALLSGTSKRERSKDATGGLLRKLGSEGVLVIKDFTSILSMARETRATVLGAFREVYDGLWSRNLGTDGGRTLTWTGRLAFVGAVTSAWDQHHAVIAAMGDRFLLIRTDSGNNANRLTSGKQALANIGSEADMRKELAEAAAGVIAAMDRTPIELTEAEEDMILAAANLVTRARTAVERDYKGNPLEAHVPEAPTRMAKQLGQVVRGAVAIGLDRDDALRLAIRCARDSMPPTRLKLIDDLAAYAAQPVNELDGYTPVADIRKRVDLPKTTVDRELQALHLLGLVKVEEIESHYRGRDVTWWHYALAEGIDPSTLRDPVLTMLL